MPFRRGSLWDTRRWSGRQSGSNLGKSPQRNAVPCRPGPGFIEAPGFPRPFLMVQRRERKPTGALHKPLRKMSAGRLEADPATATLAIVACPCNSTSGIAKRRADEGGYVLRSDRRPEVADIMFT